MPNGHKSLVHLLIRSLTGISYTWFEIGLTTPSVMSGKAQTSLFSHLHIPFPKLWLFEYQLVLMTVVSTGLCQDSVAPVEEEEKLLRCRNLVRDVPHLLVVFFCQPFTNAVTCSNLNITVYLELILSVSSHTVIIPWH